MKNYKYPLYLLFTVLILASKWGIAQEVVLSDKKKFPTNISASIEIFRDTTAKLTLEQVMAKSFQKSAKDHFIFPYTDDTFWVRFTLKNTDNHSRNGWLVWTNPLVEQLDYYISDSTGKFFFHQQQKILTKEKAKKLIDQDPKFGFELASQQTKKVYIKLTSKRGHYGTIRLHSPESYQASQLEGYSGQGFFNGLVIFRLFLVLTLSLFIIKDFAFRLYSLHTVIKTFAFWGYLNIAGPWFSDDPDLVKKIDFVFYNSVTLGAGIFVYFTQVRNKFSRIHEGIALAIIGITIFESIIIFFDYQWYWLKLGVYTIIVSATYFSGLYLYSILKKIAIERYYALPFILGLISYALLYIRLLGWIEYEPLYSLAYLLFLGEIFLFVIFLGSIFRNAQQELNFSIEQNNRLKELDNLKTSFFANISHEFRTPLTLILSPLKDLRREFPNRDIFRVMTQNAERLLSLINQLLDLSKLEAGKMDVQQQKADLAQFLNYLFSSFESLAQNKKILFQFEQSRGRYVAAFDQDKLEKIVTNLLSNAFKFTPASGRVQVRVDYTTSEMILRVQDYGIGIEKERLPRIFDRFYQSDSSTNRAYDGTGIGLALVKELVEVLSGTIAVMSTLGEGSTFVVKLPMRELAEEVEEVLPNVGPTITKTTESVEIVTEDVDKNGKDILLVVEDNPELRSYIRTIFETDYQVIEAQDGQEGFEKAIALLPDVVICDLMMPRLDGFGFCKAIKNNPLSNHIPVVMLTAKATLTDRLEGLELGADDYLPKPFDRDELQVRVRNLVKQRRILLNKFGVTGDTVNENTSESQAVERSAENRSMDEQFMEQCHDVLLQHIKASSFDVERFADLMNLSAVQLRRKLKAITGQSVTEYVRNFRLEKAAERLASKTGTVSEIAYEVGFESLSYFSRMFLEKFGKNPSEWP